MKKTDLYKCNICGNIIEVIFSGNGELYCCGQAMEKLVPKYNEDAITEKHVPVISKLENGNIEIRVGEILHPMINEHYIMFIEAIVGDNELYRKYLYPNEEPKFEFHANINDVSARELCNIHGLWEKNDDK